MASPAWWFSWPWDQAVGRAGGGRYVLHCPSVCGRKGTVELRTSSFTMLFIAEDSSMCNCICVFLTQGLCCHTPTTGHHRPSDTDRMDKDEPKAAQKRRFRQWRRGMHSQSRKWGKEKRINSSLDL